MKDPLKNRAFKSPGILEMFQEAFTGKERLLECAQIEITSHCMGACIYCPHTVFKDKWRQSHMEDETFARLWPILRKTGRAHLQGWGEPLLHPRFLDYAALARKAGCAVSTTTCGLGLNEEKAAKIVDIGLDLIAFSLAGTDAKSNAARHNVPFDKVCESIRLMDKARGQNSGISLNLAYLLLADNMESVKKLPELMEELNIDMAVISTLDYLAQDEHAGLAFNPHDRDKIRRAEEILQNVAEKAKSMGRLAHFSLPGLEPIACAGGCRENVLRTVYVNTGGEISPCVYLNVQGSENCNKTYGNVNESDALEIWDNLDYTQFRHRLASSHADSHCLVCPKRFEKIY